MALAKEKIQEILKDYGLSEGDSASPEVQVALLTARLEELAPHFTYNKKDHHSRRGLMRIVGQRRRLLAYLQKHHESRYKNLISRLGLRK